MQLSLIDPRLHPIATAAMLEDVQLRSGIMFMRAAAPHSGEFGWPHVESLGPVAGEGRQAWFIDDEGLRYVVVGRLIFRPAEFGIMHETLRRAAVEAMARLDAIGAAA